MTMPDCASLLPSVLDNKCNVQPTQLASLVSCIETTWEAPMQSARMRREPEYDVEKCREVAEAPD